MVLEGTGSIPAPGKVSVALNGGTTEEHAAKHIIIATGSVPTDLPNMPVDGKVSVTSTEALAFD